MQGVRVQARSSLSYLTCALCGRAADKAGAAVGLVQDTPVAVSRADLHVLFNQRVYIQQSIEQLQERKWGPELYQVLTGV